MWLWNAASKGGPTAETRPRETGQIHDLHRAGLESANRHVPIALPPFGGGPVYLIEMSSNIGSSGEHTLLLQNCKKGDRVLGEHPQRTCVPGMRRICKRSPGVPSYAADA